MPTYTAAIQLIAASEADVDKLDEAMRLKSFQPFETRSGHRSPNDRTTKGPIMYTYTTKANLVDASTAVSTAASSVGRKFTFTIRKEK